MNLWHLPAQADAAATWQAWLLARHWPVQVQAAFGEKAFAARWLRNHPAPALLLDEQGLWLAAHGMKMQPDWPGQWARLQRASVRNELLARACGLDKFKPTAADMRLQVLDGTAGLGHDALLLAALGAQVTAVERHPLVAALLLDEWQRGQHHAGLAALLPRVQVVHGHSGDWLQKPVVPAVDVVYLDPMFPGQSDKAARSKKTMQLLHLLHGDPASDDAVLGVARQRAARVVVKRPRHGDFLAHMQPDHQWLGEAVRFDGYFQPAVRARAGTAAGVTMVHGAGSG